MLDVRTATIFYYMQTKRFAAYKMTKFIAPLDSIQLEEMQIMYGIYFNSFISLIEYIKNDLAHDEILENCYQVLGNENNYKYVKELRNSIIHRGLNVSLSGCTLKNTDIVVPFAPAIVYDRSGNISYSNFTDNLFQLVMISENVNSFIFSLCNDLNLLEYMPMTKEMHDKKVQDDPSMPDYAKEMSLKAELDYDNINKDLKQIHENRIKRYFNTQDLFQILKEV